MEQIFQIWSRRKWLAIVVAAAVFTAVASVVTVLPDIYRSTATVLVERHKVPETFIQSLVTGELETRLQTISHEILSRARLEGLIARFGLYADSNKGELTQAVVERMRSDIQLELKSVDQTSGRGATIAFNLSYRGREPETVAKVTNTLASFYVQENARLREQQVAGTAAFLRSQLADMKKRLDAQDRRVQDFRARYVGELPQHMAVNLATLERLRAQLDLNGAHQLRATDRRSDLERQLADAEAPSSSAPPDAATERLVRLKQDLRELQTRFTDMYPDVIRLKLEIDTLERVRAKAAADTAAAPPMPVSPSVLRVKAMRGQLDAEIKALQAEEQSIRRDIAAHRQRVENAPQREQEFGELSRDYETTKDLYQALLKRYEDAQLAESMEHRQKGEHFRILDPALRAKEPIAPNRPVLMLGGLMLALGMAAAVAVLVEQLDTSFHSVNSLRALTKGPVLLSIPRIVTAADRGRRKWRSCLAAAAVLLALALISQGAVYFGRGNEQLVTVLGRWKS